MTDRLYEVSVTQTMEIVHVVKAPSKLAARRIVEDLTLGRIERDDPRLVSQPSGQVGEEKVSALVVLLDERGRNEHV